jgi:hypothetical protein
MWVVTPLVPLRLFQRGKRAPIATHFSTLSLGLKHNATSIALKAAKAKRGRGESEFFLLLFCGQSPIVAVY